MARIHHTWEPDPRIESLRDATDEKLQDAVRAFGFMSEVTPRIHGSPFYTNRIPDLHTLGYSRYMDATGTHRLRGPEDVARYAALVTGTDSMEFGKHRILRPDNRRIRYRYADEVLYAIGLYLLSLEPPRNPDPAPAALVARGQQVFKRETCVQCHAPPNYTTGKLTLAQGYTPPADHPYNADIVNVSVGTARAWP